MNNRDIDLMKIQVLDNSFHSWFTFMASILAGGIIGLLILSATLYYEKILGDLAFYLSLGFIVIFMFYGFHVLNKSYNKHLDFMNDLLLKIEKGEQLPSLTELKKQIKTKRTSK